MKKLLLGVLMLFAMQAFAQSTHTVDFETPGVGADWEWVVDQNDDNPPVEFIANPVSGGINTSETVAKFIARQNGQPWALSFTDDDGQFTFDEDNSIVKIMVYKEVISNVAIKFEGLSPAIEIQESNTVTGEWEELTYDFSEQIGNTYSRIVIIPDLDFDPRPQDNIVYFDNLQVPDGEVTTLPEPTTVPPVPTQDPADVISIYTEVYDNIPGTNFNPFWGQSTIVTVDYEAAGNYTLKYENLNYQGTEFTSQDVSLYDYLHVDFWTPNSTTLDFYLISPGAETAYSLPIENETWVSVDIPLSEFVPPVDLSNVIQFKVVGNGTVYFDNWYFWKEGTPPGSDATLSDLQYNGTTVPGFSPNVLNYDVELPEGTTEVPTVTAITNDPDATYVVNDAPELPGTTEVVVTAEDGTTTLTYNINFTIAGPEPTTVPPIPPHAAEDVISIYSDAYEDVAGTNFNPFWGQSTIVTVDYEIAGNNTLMYENLNYQGTELVTLDVSEYDYFHVDFWTANSTDLGFFLISPGPQEKEYVFDIEPETWVSVDIPMEYFTPEVNLSDIIQFKVEGNGDIWFDNWYFWKEAGGTGTLSFYPQDGATDVPVDVSPTLTFSLPVEMADGNEITNGNIPSIVTFNETDAGGAPVPFTGEINAEKTAIILTPDNNLQNEQDYYVALNDVVIRYQGGDLIPAQSATFTTVAAPKPYLEADVQDNFEDDGWSTIPEWFFQDPDMGELPVVEDPTDPTNHVAEYDRSGEFEWTNAQFELEHRMDLSERNKFSISVYFPSSNDYSGDLTPTAALKLQDSQMGGNAWMTQTQVMHEVTEFDSWVDLEFDFSAVSDSTNYDKVVVQCGGEGHFFPGLFYFDDIYLMENQVQQNISLQLGYQFVSTGLSFENADMTAVCEELINNETLDFVRSSDGNMLRKIGPNWINNIGDWVTTEGYVFKMLSADALMVEGMAIDPQTPVSLEVGFFFISYLPENPMDAEIAMETVLDNMDFLRDSQGQMLRKVGPNWINNIGDLEPGQGYLIRMDNEDELVYPAK
ncbi:MAG: Ig-like domain-containing protein [Bacteroidales bacterium]|nr:Ig-like domain-containing protein [Bacteroidales bacterium]